MMWNEFIFFALPAVILWLSAGILVYTKINRRYIDSLMLLGIVIFAVFITGLWVGQEHPPMRTMGETRLWYSFFLSFIGFLSYKQWKYTWLLSFSSLVSCIFVFINIFKPEIHTKNLMPALQSIWFIPHVTAYIFSYAMLGAATIASIIGLRKINKGGMDKKLYEMVDNLVYAGFAFLMLGMLMGCVWAKQAWGHYWSWDPKETWAFATAAAYLVYIHLRIKKDTTPFALWVLLIAFILLLITWIGVNYLPATAGSIHTY